MNLRSLIPTAAAVTGFAAGYLQSGSPDSHRINEANTPATSTSVRPRGELPANVTIEQRRLELRKQLRLVSNSPSRAQRAYGFVQLFASLDLDDLKLATELINEVPSFCRSEAKSALMLRLVEIDPQEARKFVEHADGEGDNLTYELMQAWRQKDPDAALLWYTGLDRGFGRAFQAAFLFRSWPKDDFEHAVTLVLSAPKQFGEDGIRAVFERLGADDPSAAMTRAETIEGDKFRRCAMDAVMKAWAGKDPESALRWFDQISDESVRVDAAAALSAGLFEKDPNRAIEIVHSLPEGEKRNDALAGLVRAGWSGEHRKEALEILAQLPFEPDGKVKSIYFGWFFTDAASAMNHLLPRIDPANTDAEERQSVQEYLNGPMVSLTHGTAIAKAIGAASGTSFDEFRGALLEKCVSYWAGGSQDEVRSWAQTLPEGAPRNRAMAGALQAWAWQAMKDAGEWLDQQPASAARDAAISGFVKGGLSHDPAEALTRMRTISDEALRLNSLQGGWQNWCNRDRSAAEKWRDSSPDLTAAERAYLSR